MTARESRIHIIEFKGMEIHAIDKRAFVARIDHKPFEIPFRKKTCHPTEELYVASCGDVYYLDALPPAIHSFHIVLGKHFLKKSAQKP
jgi:hypothetical protein